MKTKTEQLVSSTLGLRLAAWISQVSPPRLGYAIANAIGGWIATRRASDLVKAVRANQWVAAGEAAAPQVLDQAVQEVFQNSARALYEMHHYLHDLDAANNLFVLDPPIQALLNRPEFDQRGLVIAGLHISNFDLALQVIYRKIKPLMLTIPNPEGGRRMEFEIRKQTGINLVPGSVAGLRQAMRHLKKGGVVATGIDRPQAGCDPRPSFFGRPASLPTHHIFLALKMNVPVIILSCHLELDGKYHISATPPIEMDHYPSRSDELLYNAEKVLAIAEGIIRHSPRQWLVSQPVWPDTINLAPG